MRTIQTQIRAPEFLQEQVKEAAKEYGLTVSEAYLVGAILFLVEAKKITNQKDLSIPGLSQKARHWAKQILSGAAL